MKMTTEHTAALIIVGDEILCGSQMDTNTFYIANCLYAAGIKLQKVITLPDKVDDISQEVLAASKSYSTVFTCGGVGPTHDDLTYEAIAKAFDLKLETNSHLLDLYSKSLPEKPEFHRLAMVPSSCELINIESKYSKITYAVIKVRNVYVLPGSPKYCRPAVNEIVSQLQGGLPLFGTSVDVVLDELFIVKILDEHVARYKDVVSFGSYPKSDDSLCTKITLEGKQEDVLKAKRDFVASLPSSAVIVTDKFTLHEARAVFRTAATNAYIKNALSILDHCYNIYKASEILLSFNGGKDCTVVLHLAATIIRLRGLEPLVCLYALEDSFPEVDAFVEKASEYYDLQIVKKEAPVHEAVTKLVNERPSLKACLMGMRKIDPGSVNLDSFTPTDPGWPSLMRVNPILDWSYKQVWDFILMHNIPYCPLYDQGYTSLGAKSKTVKNPLLMNPENPSVLLPAHNLADDSTERQGRR